MTNHHYERARDHLDQATAAKRLLRDLYDQPAAARDPRDVARLNTDLGDAMKLAEVHATLAIAATLEEQLIALRSDLC